MKKRTTRKIAPLAAASFLSLALVAPASAGAMPMSHHASSMPGGMTWQYPMHDLMGMQMDGGDMWSLPHDMPMSWDQAWYPGVVDDFAASITLVHIQVSSDTDNKEAAHYDDKKVHDNQVPKHDQVAVTDHKEDSNKDHQKSDQHWEHNGVMYHHADEHKDYDHKEEDCLKDDSHDVGKYKVVWHQDGYWDYERKDWMGDHDEWKQDDQKYTSNWKHDNHEYQHASYKEDVKNHWSEDDCNREEQAHKTWERDNSKHDNGSSYEHVSEWDKKEDHKDDYKHWDSKDDKHHDSANNNDQKHGWSKDHKEDSKESDYKSDDYKKDDNKHDNSDDMKETENRDKKQYKQHVTYR